jgi:hypothetical protein
MPASSEHKAAAYTCCKCAVHNTLALLIKHNKVHKQITYLCQYMLLMRSTACLHMYTVCDLYLHLSDLRMYVHECTLCAKRRCRTTVIDSGCSERALVHLHALSCCTTAAANALLLRQLSVLWLQHFLLLLDLFHRGLAFVDACLKLLRHLFQLSCHLACVLCKRHQLVRA